MELSNKDIQRLKGKCGGFTRRDIERWGLTFPLRKGWKKRLLQAVGKQQLSDAEFAAKHHKPKRKKKIPKWSIYGTERWKQLRYEVLCEQGSTCQICGATPRDGIRMNVDHIIPISMRKDLAFVKSNLRVLCSSCNWGKGSRHPSAFEKEWNRVPWERFESF